MERGRETAKEVGGGINVLHTLQPSPFLALSHQTVPLTPTVPATCAEASHVTVPGGLIRSSINSRSSLSFPRK